MTTDERREQIIAAARSEFAEHGYQAATTDAIARRAGVSQPYVVRMFGTKLELFLEVLGRSCDRIREAFDAVLAQGPFDPDNEDDWAPLGMAYTDLL